MKNKCSVFFFSVLFILALSFVLGESSCSSEDTILKLSSETNAHAAIWNDTNYDSSLCYTDFFNNEGKTLSHECEGLKGFALRLDKFLYLAILNIL